MMMDAVYVCTQTSFLTTAGILVANGALAEIWAMINAIQILAYIFYMNLYMPANAERYFDFLMELSEFDLIDMSPVYELLFRWIAVFDPENVVISQEEEE
jgi:hypothetical protein